MTLAIQYTLKALAAIIIGYAMVNAVLADSITLRDTAQADTASVKLADVAKLQGELATKLADVEVTTFAAEQETLSLTMADVRRVLSGHRVHWGKVTCRGAQRITVTRTVATKAETAKHPAPQTIVAPWTAALANPLPSMEAGVSPIVEGHTLRDRLIDWIADSLGAGKDELRIACRNETDPDWQLSDTVGRFEFEAGNNALVGRVPMIVRQYGQNEQVRTVRVSVDVQRKLTVAVAAGELRRGQIVTAGDIAMREMWQTGAMRQPITDASQIVGQSVVRHLRPGDVVSANDVQPPVVVQRGQLVTVRCVSGALVLKSVMRAMEDGSTGELISMRNERTRETVSARVTGPQEAVMMLSAAPGPHSVAKGGTQ